MTTRLEVITGPMFSGKSEEFIRRLKRADIGKVPLAVFKPMTDTRAGGVYTRAHQGTFDAIELRASTDLLAHVGDARVVGIDEAQFFDAGLADVVRTLLHSGRRVIVAGLDLTFEARPFPVMAELLCLANEVVKLPAVCSRCSEDAWRSQRVIPSTETVLVGDADAYEPRCLAHFELPA